MKEPTFLAQPRGENALYVAERRGVVVAVGAETRTEPRPFLDLHERVSNEGEGALSSLAFAPDYARSGRMYVAYAGRDRRLHVDEYRSAADGSRADPRTRRSVLSVRHRNDIHWSGQLQFGPDGLLYVGVGDGGPDWPLPSTAQERSSLLGKILRIDPRPSGGSAYTVPRDNPLVGRPGADEIFATGLRNPWRFSFDRETGDLWIGDVGNFTQEEIDRATPREGPGADFGWPEFEGTAPTPSDVTAADPVPPVFTYERTGGPDDPYCAVTGGYVARDASVPRLEGRYVYADFCEGEIRGLRLRDGRIPVVHGTGLEVPQLNSFGEDAGGRLYALSLDGAVYRLVQPGAKSNQRDASGRSQPQ